MKKKTSLRMLFLRFAITLVLLLAASAVVPFGLLLLASNAGLVTYANQTELAVKALVPVLETAPDITTVSFPPYAEYLLLDRSYTVKSGNMRDTDQPDAIRFAKGELVESGLGKSFLLVVRDTELCVVAYEIGSRFLISWLPEGFLSPEIVVVFLICLNVLCSVIFLISRFSKTIRTQFDPLYEATMRIKEQNLDFTVGESNIREFDEALQSFSDMKNSLRDSLEEKWRTEQMRRDQIAALAHDLKTPLTVVQGNADLIAETALSAEQHSYASSIRNSAEQMGRYINTLIELANASSGHRMKAESIPLKSFMESIRDNARSLCVAKNITLQMDVSDLPETITIDRMLMERAILNVIHNAVDHASKPGFIHVNVFAAQNLMIDVTDNGPGFSTEALLHAKEQFYMGDFSRSSNLHFGAGLYIADTIVRQHHGILLLQNDENTHGAKVTIELPLS